jgi:hypothetical protein
MGIKQKLLDEIRAVGIAALYFGCWIGALLLFKSLVLAEYKIAFYGWTKAVVGALVLSKVVLVFEQIPLGAWVRARPAWVDLILRTAMYTLGVAAVLILEKGLEGRQEYGGFVPALRYLFQHEDVHHLWVNTFCLSGALLGYNAMSIVKRHLGEGGLFRIFFSPLPKQVNRNYR